MAQTDRTLQETRTSLAPGEVIEAAKRFFTRRNSIYTAFVDMEGPTFVTLRGAGGEEIAVAAAARDAATLVTASTYLFDQQVARFLASLPIARGDMAHPIPEFLPASTSPSVSRSEAI